MTAVPGEDGLAQLHESIQQCGRCRDHLDPAKALRVRESVPSTSSLFLVAQALARTTQRATGVAYFDDEGKFESTGRALEPFLNKLGATLYPPKPVQLPKATIPAAGKRMKTVYASEIVQCFPGGKKGQGDRFSPAIAKSCLGSGFLEREIELVNPKVILLLGSKSYQWFWRHFARKKPAQMSIRAAIQQVVDQGRIDTIPVAGRSRYVVPLVHASGQTMGLFRRLVLENEPLRKLIIGLLGAST